MKNVSDLPPLPELLNAAQAASLAGVGVRSWHRFAAEGRAPRAVKIGRCVRWRRADLRNWIDAGCPSCRKEVSR